VRHAAPGTYCLTPAASIQPAGAAPVVGGEAGLSGPGVIPLAVLDGRPTACAVTEIEVQTYNAAGTAGPTPSDDAAFTILVP
jgi:hypothetical protein